MRSATSFASLACGVASAIFLGGIVLISPDCVLADEAATKTNPNSRTCSCPSGKDDAERPKLWPKPKFAEHRPRLEQKDEIAALEAVHLALTEVGDGSSYVWHQRNGRLSGVVQPTSSFRDATGKICRHIVVALSAEGVARSTEGIACRLGNGSWQLEG